MYFSPRFLCRLTALIKLLVAVACSRWTATSNFINAVKRQRNLGLHVFVLYIMMYFLSSKTCIAKSVVMKCITHKQGRIQDFKLGGGAHLKKIAPSGGRRENFWGISCENSRFYAKKSRLQNLPPTPNLQF